MLAKGRFTMSEKRKLIRALADYILQYNGILKKVAAEENAVVNDLYAVVAPAKAEMIGEDHIHLTPAGVEAVASQTAAVLRAALGE